MQAFTDAANREGGWTIDRRPRQAPAILDGPVMINVTTALLDATSMSVCDYHFEPLNIRLRLLSN